MIICHGSDWHGCVRAKFDGHVLSIFPEIKEDFDIFVMSGDFLPNSIWGANQNKNKLRQDIKFQENWVRAYARDLNKCIKNKPFLFSSGNHDFINPCKILQDNGVNAIDLDNKVVEFMGLTWYGFPYIPIMNNNWNHERNSNDMRAEIISMNNRLKEANIYNKLDILVAHCPLANLLDWTGTDHIGNSHMSNTILYEMENMPRLYLCGHNHEQFGQCAWLEQQDRTKNSMFMSNAATTYRIIGTEHLPDQENHIVEIENQSF